MFWLYFIINYSPCKGASTVSKQKHSKQVISEFEHSNSLKHSTPKSKAAEPKERGPYHPPAKEFRACNPLRSQSLRALGMQPVLHQLKLQPHQSYHTSSTELIWASCPAGVAKREGPSVRHASSAQMCYL